MTNFKIFESQKLLGEFSWELQTLFQRSVITTLIVELILINSVVVMTICNWASLSWDTGYKSEVQNDYYYMSV